MSVEIMSMAMAGGMEEASLLERVVRKLGVVSSNSSGSGRLEHTPLRADLAMNWTLLVHRNWNNFLPFSKSVVTPLRV